MRIHRLLIEQFRLFEHLSLELGSRLNVFTGDNGSGKTSILEAIYLLAYGRSFRGGIRDGLIRRGQNRLRIVAELIDPSGSGRRIGLERGVREWQARVQGQNVAGLSELYRELAVVCFEPGSHDLISGSSELRRRFADWGLFHVEPAFLTQWRRYQRALRQRNALLKTGTPDIPGLAAWEKELADSGEALTQQREAYLAELAQPLADAAQQFLPELGRLTLRFQRGWASGMDLGEALATSRTRDLLLGHTSIGPHRADWAAGYDALPDTNTFSRGQEKLTALSCVLAQAAAYAERLGHWPVIALDDLASELDRRHLAATMSHLASVPAQLLLTGTQTPDNLTEWSEPAAAFHVKQGDVRRLL
jgi:DNA replication and repair protein RecF